jgi:predicted anti-sigma-YlaC factor YlaD
MKPDCLNERDLILLHYREAPDRTTAAAAAAHLADCPACRNRAGQLAAELARVPPPAAPDPLAATRVAARVNERLDRKRRWLPLAGAAATAAIALMVVVWSPSDQPPLPGSQQPVAGLKSPAPELELLEQLDLLEELDTLRAIEGV